MIYLYDTMLNDRRIPYLLEKDMVCEERIIANSPDLVVQTANDLFQLHKRSEEYLYMFAMTSKSEILGIFEISHGTVNASLVTPREVFMKALMCGAVGIVLIHNHPSGDCCPSQADTDLAKRIQKAGELLGVELLDFVIDGGNGRYDFYSFQQYGLLGAN